MLNTQGTEHSHPVASFSVKRLFSVALPAVILATVYPHPGICESGSYVPAGMTLIHAPSVSQIFILFAYIQYFGFIVALASAGSGLHQQPFFAKIICSSMCNAFLAEVFAIMLSLVALVVHGEKLALCICYALFLPASILGFRVTNSVILALVFIAIMQTAILWVIIRLTKNICQCRVKSDSSR